MAAQTIIIADELTRFLPLLVHLHWLSFGLVRHMCSRGNGLIQCLGHGTEDLSHPTESPSHHKLLLKDLRLVSLSVRYFSQEIEKKDISLVRINS